MVAKNDLGTAISVSRVVIELPSASETEDDFVAVAAAAAAAAEETRSIAYKPVASNVVPTEKSKTLPKPPVSVALLSSGPSFIYAISCFFKIKRRGEG